MEVFTGDHALPTDVVLFPDTPFVLPTAHAFSDHHHFLPPQPPQKLRPIRCNARSFSEEDPLVVKPLSWQPETAFYDSENDGGGLLPPKDSTLGLAAKESQTQAALSSSSDESSKLQDANKEPENKKKRKRKSKKKLKSLIKEMMKTVMEKQEEMHKQLIEVLEKKETERIQREEAWKQQEIERAKKEEQSRAQEISRSLALISFIQKSLGQEIQIPNGLEPPNLEKDHNQNEENLKGNIVNDLEENLKGNIVTDQEENLKGNIVNDQEESECDLNHKRWPKSEVQALITVRAALNNKFNTKGPKATVWEEVAAGLLGMGYNRTPKKCKEKWENINKYYRRTMEKGKENGVKSQVCTYFTELEMLHKTGFISGNSPDEDQSMKVLN